MLKYTMMVVACLTASQLFAQSRIIGDTYTFSAGNFPDSFGTTYDPIIVPRGQEFFDLESLDIDGDEWGGDPIELTFDGIAEQAGGLMVNERVEKWDGVDGGIFAVQAAGIDGETEFDLLDWENPGEILEFSFTTVDGSWPAAEVEDNSFYSLIGLDWADSDANEVPFFFEQGFYFYFSKDGEAITGYEAQAPELGVLVGEHPFDESIDEVVYIAYSRGQVEEATKPYDGGFHLTGGTTQLDANASWALLLQTMGVAPSDQNGVHWGFLVDEPNGPDVTFETGDVNRDGEINATDINLLTQAVNDGNADGIYDINGDSNVDASDRTAWVEEIQNTYFGDANLDGEFNSGDFVTVFSAGEYEDDIDGNSTWSTGDWNGDGDFNSGDFVVAFGAAGYEKGPRPIATVPEPSSCLLLGLGAAMLARRRRKRSA